LKGVKEIPAGNIVGIAGLEDYVYKTATLSSSLDVIYINFYIPIISINLIKLLISDFL
jgi:translation elongation factor EF-G